jgi:chromosome segregation ATPase
MNRRHAWRDGRARPETRKEETTMEEQMNVTTEHDLAEALAAATEARPLLERFARLERFAQAVPTLAAHVGELERRRAQAEGKLAELERTATEAEGAATRNAEARERFGRRELEAVTAKLEQAKAELVGLEEQAREAREVIEQAEAVKVEMRARLESLGGPR